MGDDGKTVEEQVTSATGFKFNKKTVIGLGTLLLLVIAIPIGVYLAQQTQIFKPKASEIQTASGPEASLSFWAPTGGELGTEIRVGIVVRSDLDAANLVVSKLKFPTDLLEVSSIDVTTGPTFVKNWIEKTFDNTAGTVSLSGGLPAPGFKTTVGQHGEWMAQVIFKTKKVGTATVIFDTDSAIYRNSDNSNILRIKRDVSLKIENPVIPTPTSVQAVRRVFVVGTSATPLYNGNLGGLAGADSKCQAKAKAANLSGIWKAWLSDNTVSAASRLEHANVPYKLINGALVANNWADLTDGTVQTPINISETGAIMQGNVWSGTRDDGTIINQGESKCLNWTSSTDSSGPGAVGHSGYTDYRWSWGSSYACSSNFSLYCIEQGSVAPTPTPAGIKGDVNGDGKISLVDMSALLTRWAKTGAEAGKADINLDGVVNTFDYSLMLQILVQNGVIKGATDLPTALQR